MLMGIRSKRVGQPAVISGWQSLVCLLLIALLLYNPFVALIHSHAGLTVHHPPRNRATVGASELQHYTPVGKNLSVVATREPCAIELFVQVTQEKAPLATEVSPFQPIRSDFSSNLWFRPPPSL